MSLSERIEVSATPRREVESRPHGYGFILVLVCVLLALAIAATVFTPVNIGEGMEGVLLIGP